MRDPPLDALAETARNRGLKLVRSRVRTPGKRRFGKVGLTDAKGQPVFGMDVKGPIAKPEDVEDYLRNLGAKDWGASLHVAVLPRKRARTDRERPSKPAEVIPLRPAATGGHKAKRALKPKPPPPPPKPAIRSARPSDGKAISRLIDYLGHPLSEKAVKKNLVELGRLNQLPLVATLGREVVGLCGVSQMVTVHRDAPVGRISALVVSKEAQGHGIGRMLVQEAEQLLKKAGCKIVEVTSNDRRSAAHAFYRHLGYERTSMRFMKKL